MKILEFGNQKNKKMILVHGFQCPVEIWNDYIDYYKEKYHVIVPILPGHNPNEVEDFISFYETAKELEEYIISKYGKEIYVIFGMSMGGVLATTLLKRSNLKFNHVIFDGSPLASINSFVKKMMTKFYISVTHKAQKKDEKTIKNAETNIVPKKYINELLALLNNLSDTSIKNYIYEISNFKLSTNIDLSDTKVTYFHGTKMNEMLAKKTAKHLKKHYPKINIIKFKGKAHCENSIFYPQIMIKEINNIMH